MSANNGASKSTQRAPKPHVRKSVSNLAHDAIELGELQLKLLKVDSCEAGRSMRSSILLSCIGFALLLGSMPVVLLAIAEALVTYGEWTRTAALVASAGGALLICLVFTVVGLRKLKQSLSTWERSSEEFSRNVAWLKTALRSDAGPAASDIKLTTTYPETTSRFQ